MLAKSLKIWWVSEPKRLCKFPMRGSCGGPGGSFRVELQALDFFKVFIKMKRKRKKEKRREMEERWSSIMIEESIVGHMAIS